MENQKLTCEVCSQTFVTKTNFEHHVLKKMKKCTATSLQKECTVCNVVFTRNTDFRRHQKNKKHLNKVGKKIINICLL